MKHPPPLPANNTLPLATEQQISPAKAQSRKAVLCRPRGGLGALAPWRDYMLIGMLLIAAALGLRLYMMHAASCAIPVTSDEAINVLQARDIRAGHTPLLMTAQPYQFPLEPYLMAPWIKLFPAGSVLRARFLPYALGLVGLGLGLWLVRRLGPLRQTWPAALLLLFPGAYHLVLQAGYIPPHYASPPLLWLLVVALAFPWPARRPWLDDVRMLLAGGLCGLAVANYMMSLAVVAPAALVIVTGGAARWPRVLRRLLVFAPAFVLGLVPLLLGAWFFPGAHAGIAGLYPWKDALRRLWNPTLAYTLPHALGVAPPLYPDGNLLPWGMALARPAAFIYLLILAAATARIAWRMIQAARNRTMPELLPGDIFAAASWLGLALFAAGRRADAQSFRYLLPVIWAFPFVVAVLVTGLSRRWVLGAGAAAVLLAGFNITTTFKLTADWRAPDFAAREVGAEDLQPALYFLRQQGISNCVASYWAAYRINFLTDGSVVCSQPVNERFPGWPLPFKDEVDAATDVAYVLTERIRFLKPSVFERHLRTMDVTADRTPCGNFVVYQGFRDAGGADLPLGAGRAEVVASHNTPEDARMADGDPTTAWNTKAWQSTSMWVQATWTEPRRIDRVTLDYGRLGHDAAPAVALQLLTTNGWQATPGDPRAAWDPFRMRNRHPVYGAARQSLRFAATEAAGIRLAITEPNPRFCWTIAELEIRAAASGTSAGK